MSGADEVHQVIRELGDNVDELKNKQSARIEKLEETAQMIEAFMAKQSAPFGGIGHKASTMSADDHKALSGACRALLAGDQAKAYQHFREVKGMSAGSDPDGGYVIVPQFSSDMTRIMAEISPMARLARTINLDQGSVFEEVIDRDQAEANWVGELQSRGDTAHPDLGLLRIEAHEICAQPKASQKLIDTSAIDVVAWLQGKVAEAFGTTESAAFHSGNGVAKPRGFLSYTTAATADATRTWGVLEHIATGASGAFATPSTSVNSADVLVDTVGALRAQYRNGASWLMNRKTAAAVRKLKDADGRHVWVDSLLIGQPSLLLGYPVEISEDMPDIAADSLSIAFGNFAKGYTVVRRMGIKFLVDPYTDKPNVRLYTYQRVGGNVNNFEAIKLVKFANS